MTVPTSAKDSFKKDVLDKKGLVLVDFYADWCAPCRVTSPIIEQLSKADKYKDKVKFVKIDVDDNQELASKYQVFSIPTFIIFKDGQPVNQLIGALGKEAFEKELDKTIKNG